METETKTTDKGRVNIVEYTKRITDRYAFEKGSNPTEAEAEVLRLWMSVKTDKPSQVNELVAAFEKAIAERKKYIVLASVLRQKKEELSVLRSKIDNLKACVGMTPAELKDNLILPADIAAIPQLEKQAADIAELLKQRGVK